MRVVLIPFLLTTLVTAQSAAAPTAPQTVPEATGHAQTSRLADVQKFLDALMKLPHGNRVEVSVLGKTHEGRPLLLARAALPAADPTRLRAVVIANIHAGECEGKEAAQMLLREFALGQHEDLLRAVDLWFVPVYNPDGNEAVDRRNRPEQNGPDLVGRRPNGQGLDLNRDFVKADAPETRALLRLIDNVDPHVFMDLHTTDGSTHGYHLTFAPSLATSLDPEIASYSRKLLDDVTAAMQQDHGYRVFDYGNFETRDWEGNGAPESKGQRGWWTYDWRARYGINWFGLRNRIAVLSEAYSYADFQTRIAATRAFVLTVLGKAAADRDDLRATCERADRRLLRPDAPQYFGFDSVFGDPEFLPVLVGQVDRVELPDGLGTRLSMKPEFTAETMPVVRRFRARQQLALPFGWALADAEPAVLDALQLHGVAFERLAEPRRVVGQQFAVTGKRKPKRPYQGHQELQLSGSWQAEATIELAAGTIWIPGRQARARLAAQLLEPQSEDSLSTWNFLEARTTDTYPVLRVLRQP